MSVEQPTLSDFADNLEDNDDKSPVEIDLPQLPPADDVGDVDEDSPVRWRDYDVEPHDPDDSTDAGISESGALAILNRPALTDWDADEILTEEERTRDEEVSEHSFSK